MYRKSTKYVFFEKNQKRNHRIIAHRIPCLFLFESTGCVSWLYSLSQSCNNRKIHFCHTSRVWKKNSSSKPACGEHPQCESFFSPWQYCEKTAFNTINFIKRFIYVFHLTRKESFKWKIKSCFFLFSRFYAIIFASIIMYYWLFLVINIYAV